jgi:glutaredoxin
VKAAVVILVLLGIGLTFMLRDLRHLQDEPTGEPPASSQSEASEPRVQGGAATTVYYQYTSDTGAVLFATRIEDVPPDRRATAGRVEMQGPPPDSRRAVREARERSARVLRPRAAAPVPLAVAAPARVTIYTTSTCPYCRSAMRYMDSIGQAYTNKDVERDPAAHEEYRRKTGGRQGVPLIDVDGRIMQGWDRERLDELLGRS